MSHIFFSLVKFVVVQVISLKESETAHSGYDTHDS